MGRQKKNSGGKLVTAVRCEFVGNLNATKINLQNGEDGPFYGHFGTIQNKLASSITFVRSLAHLVRHCF